jgi:hypothetical protein
MGEALRLYYSLKKAVSEICTFNAKHRIPHAKTHRIHIYRENGFLAQCVLGFA